MLQQHHRLVVLLAITCACGSTPSGQSGGVGADAAGGGARSLDAGKQPSDTGKLKSDTDASVSNDGASSNCALAATKYIYVGTVDNHLYQFDPVALTFHDLGAMSCAQPDAQPGFCSGLAVDRQGIVWVNYNTGGGGGTNTGIFRLDPSTMNCTESAFDPQGTPAIFDLSFVSNGPSENEETLYLSLFPHGLAYVDSSWKIHRVTSPTDKLYASSFDLQGTAQGVAFGLDIYGESSPAYLAQIDPATGAVATSYSLPGVYSTYGTAFGYWGGKFWIFGNEEPDPSSTTIQLFDPGTGELSVVKSDIGFTIDAAGVSTCAPPTIPK